MSKSLRQFVCDENIKHFKKKLDVTTDEAERRKLLKLLAEEEAASDEDQPAPRRA